MKKEQQATDLIVRKLVNETRILVPRIVKEYPEKLRLNFSDMTKSVTDLSGWVLEINQIYINPERGFTEDNLDSDPYFRLVTRAQLSEAILSAGKIPTTYHQWLDENNSLQEVEIRKLLSADDYFGYLNSILKTGEARPRIV